MTIEEKTMYTATSLPGAPPRETRAEAEADEARGIELAAFLAVLPTLTEEQWERVAAWDEAWDAARTAARTAAWEAKRIESWDATRLATRRATQFAPRDVACFVAWDAARAIVVRDRITPDQFDTLTAPLRAAGVNFDGLTNHNEQEQGR